MARILGIGNATLDIIHTVDGYPRENDEIRCTGRTLSRGGNVANTLVVRMYAGTAPEVVETRCQRVHLIELLQRRADAQRLVDRRGGHLVTDLGDPRGELGKAQMAMRVDEHGSAAARRQIVCVGLADEIAVPRISSMRMRSVRVFSSAGKRTPTPCVRPPDALAGVIHATLPATG